MSENKGNFLLFAADYLIQQSCGGTLRFPCSVSVDIHCGTDISVSEKLLHILWCCPMWEQIACECVAKLVEMEVLQPLDLFPCRPAHNPYRTRRLKRSVRSEADKSPKDRPKRKVSETGSGSYRQRASSKEHERSPKTENDNFDIEHDTTGQNLCLAEFHISLKCLSNFIKKPPASYSWQEGLFVSPISTLIWVYFALFFLP